MTAGSQNFLTDSKNIYISVLFIMHAPFSEAKRGVLGSKSSDIYVFGINITHISIKNNYIYITMGLVLCGLSPWDQAIAL